MNEKIVENSNQIITQFGEKIKSFDEQFNTIESKITVTPDDFEGSDVEKLQSAFDYCISNDCKIIKLNRVYDITGGSIYLPNDNFWQFITFIGGEIIKNDEGYMFDSLGIGNNRNSPKFINVRFTTSSNNVYVSNGDKMIRQFADNCIFTKIGLVKTTNYIQTVRLHNCEVGQLACNFIDADNCFDSEIIHCRFESNTSNHNAIKIQTNGDGISYFGLRIINNLFEGYTLVPPVFLGVGYGLNIDTNYFEQNNTHIKIDNNNMKATLVAGIIQNNTFGATISNFDIEINSTVNVYKLYVKNNSTNVPSGKYLCSRYIQKDFDESNNVYAGGAFAPISKAIPVRDTSYSVNQVSMGDEGVKFEIPLQLKNEGILAYQSNKQFLVNIKCNFGGSVYYSGHLTGILSIDGFYTDGSAQQVILFTKLSTRNTSGNVNGNTANEDNYNIYFKESGTTKISNTVESATIVIELPKMKYNTSYNKCSFKAMNNIVQEYQKDYNV